MNNKYLQKNVAIFIASLMLPLSASANVNKGDEFNTLITDLPHNESMDGRAAIVLTDKYQYLSEDRDRDTVIYITNTGIYTGWVFIEYYLKGRLHSIEHQFHVNYYLNFTIPKDAYFVRVRVNRLTGSLFDIPDIYNIKVCQATNIYRNTQTDANALKLQTWGTSLFPHWNYEHPSGSYQYRQSGPTCGPSALNIYEDRNAAGRAMRIENNVPDLGVLSDKISSYSIPDTWTVRFFTGKNYTGDYYTRIATNQYVNYAGDFKNKIKSIQIISKG